MMRRPPALAARFARFAHACATAAVVLAALGGGLDASAAEPRVGDPSSAAQPFRTRAADFEPQPWHALPGWPDEQHLDAFSVFVDGCAGLQRRPVWQTPCERARGLGRVDAQAARAFFEDAFVAYRLKPLAADDPALLTGYFEPVLDGALARGGRFVFPVHGVPDDLLLLDARRLRDARADAPLRATVVGRDVVPLAPGEAPPSGQRAYEVDRDALGDEPLDRRLRLRVDGDRLVRYWRRADIEQGRARVAPIAWVDDPDALYVMQVQGSGRVRLPDGRLLHLGFGDQNGHPFRPTAQPEPGTRTRGVASGGTGAPAPAPGDEAAVAALAPTTRSLVAADPQVQRVIDALLGKPGPTPAVTGAVRPSSAGTSGKAASPPPGARAMPLRASLSDAQLARVVAARANDPSYVFFRAMPSQPRGPVGALGVALTARRSIAVDPRVTPLGAPVFIESARRGAESPLRRLMFAQDTGGAIRGVVRGDFFWGTGPDAGREAFRTRDALSMWVLLPKGFESAGLGPGVRTRSVGAAGDRECTVPDEDYC